VTVARNADNRWWSVHTHSRRSRNDAMSPVPELVERAVELGYPALGLTDHGTVGGAAELYVAGRKAGLAVAPGTELYLTSDAVLGERSPMHLTVIARTEVGYRNLVGLNNYAHRNFYFQPRADFPALAGMAEDGLLEGLAVGTGCRSGPVVRALLERGPAAAEQVVLALAGWFPRLYVELMDHGFTAAGMWDHEICAELLAIADRTGLPYIITTDCHYTHREDRVWHDAYKELVVGWKSEADERHFHGEGYWLQHVDEVRAVFEPDVLDRALDSLADLAASLQVRIPELDTFTLKIPDVTHGADPMAELTSRCDEALYALTSAMTLAKAKAYQQRLTDELEVVRTSGMAPYLLLVAAITDYCRQINAWYHTRGSATGSLILWLLKVTQEDPVAWDIRFDRFLSTDRTSPPDVDIDIEHTRRDEVVAHFRKSYPILQVGTTMGYSLEGTTTEEGHDSKGSLRVKYFSVVNKDRSDEEKIKGWKDVPEDHRRMLEQLAERSLVQGRGAHPGGYIFAANETVVAALPMERIDSSGTYVTGYDKGDVEKMGFPKVDLLGSKVLTALHICCDLICGGSEVSAEDYYDGIDRKDKEAIKRSGSGHTEGLFQLSGWTQRRVTEEMKPKNLGEIVAAQAIARPAPMASGFTKEFLARREGKSEIPAMHADIMAETKATYGLAIYQEQLVGAMRRLGMGSEQLTKMLKAVKASGKAGEAAAKQAVAEELESIKALAVSRGWGPADVDWLATTLTDYGAGYSFGKAHSVQYGVVAYKTAYLVTHEPLAFWTGMLLAYTGSERTTKSGKEKLEVVYANAARKDGVRVIGAHVNRSAEHYTPDPDAYAIRKGLTSIPQVGDKAAAELVAKAPYDTLVDLAQKVLSSKVSGAKPLLEGVPPGECTGVVKALYEHGALEGIPAGEPIRRAKGRKRKCEACKVTYPTPLEYEIHAEQEHSE
jgi:DNA polymerase III alpha subunit